nr:hypothetical protein [Tanacetum cinerariifolium]
MGYKKPSTKLTFYKAFFSSQWKFLIHTILQSMSAKRTSWNEFSSTMASAVICLSTGDTKEQVQDVVDDAAAQGADTTFWNIVAIKQSNDVTRLQALVDKKKVVVTEATIRDALHLDDAEGVDCLLNEEIFTTLARMGYEKSSTKLTFYKAFFLSQWKFLIHMILQSMSAKRTSWNEFSSVMASAVICLSTGGWAKDDQGLKHLYLRGHDDTVAEEPVTAVDDVEDQTIQSPTPLTPPLQQPQNIPSTSQANIYHIDMDHATKILSMQEDEPEIQEAVEVVTTAKLITEVVAAVSETVSVAAIVQADVPAAPVNAAAVVTTAGPVKKAAKRTRQNKEAEDVEELKQHLEIVPDKDDDVYTEATPLARKVTVVDYQIIHVNNKPRYKIIRVDNTHQLFGVDAVIEIKEKHQVFTAASEDISAARQKLMLLVTTTK